MPWQVVDAKTAFPVHHPDAPRYPKLALRRAFRDRARRDELSLAVGETREILVHGREDWDKIIVKYKCLEQVTNQGSGAKFRKTYMSEDGKVQYLHTHISKEHGDVLFTACEFMVFPP